MAALPPDLRKGFAFPQGICPNQSPPLGWKAAPSSRAEEGAGRVAGKPEAFRKSGGKAASSLTLTRPCEGWPQARKPSQNCVNLADGSVAACDRRIKQRKGLEGWVSG
jgi:hypothetical protein